MKDCNIFSGVPLYYMELSAAFFLWDDLLASAEQADPDVGKMWEMCVPPAAHRKRAGQLVRWYDLKPLI